MQEDGIIIINVKFPDCGNVIQPILLACTKLRWLTLEIEKLTDKVSLERTESSDFTSCNSVLGVLEERLRLCWASQEAQWHTIDTQLDACGEISMFKRQAEMNYATKYKSLPEYGMQSSKALMKVSHFNKKPFL